MANVKTKTLSRTQWNQQAKSQIQTAFSDVALMTQKELESSQKQVKVLREKLKKKKTQEKEMNQKIKQINKKLTSSKTVALKNRLKAAKLKLIKLVREKKSAQKSVDQLVQSVAWLKTSKAQFKAGERAWLQFNKEQQSAASTGQFNVSIKKSTRTSTVAKKKSAKKVNSKDQSSVVVQLSEGDLAPSWAASSRDPNRVMLQQLRGKKVILYFYPKDNTPGCTKQAIALTEQQQTWVDANTVVVGVSRDSVASHQRFIQQHNLDLALIADQDERVCLSYGVIKDKNLYGKKVRGIERTTFLIDENGLIQKIWRKVKVDQHIEHLRSELCDVALS